VLKAARRRVFDKQGLGAVKSKAGDPTLKAGEDGRLSSRKTKARTEVLAFTSEPYLVWLACYS